MIAYRSFVFYAVLKFSIWKAVLHWMDVIYYSRVHCLVLALIDGFVGDD